MPGGRDDVCSGNDERLNFSVLLLRCFIAGSIAARWLSPSLSSHLGVHSEAPTSLFSARV